MFDGFSRLCTTSEDPELLLTVFYGIWDSVLFTFCQFKQTACTYNTTRVIFVYARAATITFVVS